MPTPAARMRPAVISPSWCTAPGGIRERDDDDSGRDGVGLSEEVERRFRGKLNAGFGGS